MIGDIYSPHLELMLNGDSIFYETPLTKYKAQDPVLEKWINDRFIQSMMVSKLKTYDKNYGYLVIFEKEITRIWQENEISLVMYISALLEMELININNR